MKNSWVIVAAIAISIGTGCKKDASVSEQQNTLTDNIVYQIARDEGNAGGRIASNINLTAGQATVTEIKFDAKGDDRLVYRSKTTRTVNLFDLVTTIGSLTVPSGTYDRIKLKIRFEPVASAPALELRGSYTPANGTTVPLIIRVDNPFESKFDVKDQVAIDQNNNLTMLSSLVLSRITDKLSERSMDNAIRDNNGTIVISSDSNKGLYNEIWNQLEDLLHVKIKVKKK